MPARLTVLATVLAAVALAAGCGDDENGEEEPARPEPDKPAQIEGPQTQTSPGARDANANAAAFIECFDRPGYEAKRPKAREESLFAYTAKAKGYRVAAVNVTEKGSIATSAFLAFFESPQERERAFEELATTSVGDVKPQQKGPAVIGYLGDEDLKAVGSAVDACLD